MNNYKFGCGLMFLLAIVFSFVFVRHVSEVHRVNLLDTKIVEAVEDNDAATVEELLREGASVDAEVSPEVPSTLWDRILEMVPGHRKRNKGVTLLSESLRLTLGDEPKRTEAVPLVLLAHGANPNVRGEHGRSPLQMAVYWNFHKAFGVLLNNGANVNARDAKGWTALYAAASYGQVDMVLQLLGKGADPNIATNNGDTPLSEAEQNTGPAGKRIKAALLKAHAQR